MGPSGHYLLLFAPYVVVGCVGTCYVLRVELLIQRRLYPIFVRDVGSPGIYERFRRLMGSQRTPVIWGVTIRPVLIGFFLICRTLSSEF